MTTELIDLELSNWDEKKTKTEFNKIKKRATRKKSKNATDLKAHLDKHNALKNIFKVTYAVSIISVITNINFTPIQYTELEKIL